MEETRCCEAGDIQGDTGPQTHITPDLPTVSTAVRQGKVRSDHDMAQSSLAEAAMLVDLLSNCFMMNRSRRELSDATSL